MREKLQTPKDFDSMAASLGITSSRMTELREHIQKQLDKDGEGINTYSVSKQLVELWNDSFYSPEELLHTVYILAYHDGKTDAVKALFEGLGNAIAARSLPKNETNKDEGEDEILSSKIVH